MINSKSDKLLLATFLIINVALYFFSYNGATFKEGADASQYYIPALSFIEYGEFLTNDGSTIFTRGTPLYSILLAIPISIFGIDESTIAIVCIQSILLYSTGFLSRQILLQFTSKFGLLLHALVVFNPNSIITAHLVQSETLFTFLIVWSVVVAFRIINDFSLKNIIFLGVLTGLATLTRPVGLYLLIFWPMFILISLIIKGKLNIDNRSIFLRKSQWAKLLSIVIIGGLVISPWYIRNYVKTGELFLTSNAGAYLSDQYFQLKNKGSGWSVIEAQKEHNRIFSSYMDKEGKSADYCLNKRDLSCNDVLTHVSIMAIAGENLTTHIKALFDSWATLFFSGGASNIRNYLGLHGKSLIVDFQSNSFNGLGSIMTLVKSMNPSYLFIFVLTTMFTTISRAVGLFGVYCLLKNNKWRPYGLLIFEVILIFTAAYLYLGQSRFRVPLEPFLMLFTVIGIAGMVKKYRKITNHRTTDNEIK